MREISWVSPQYVASQARVSSSPRTPSGDGDGERDSNEPTGPGLHGTGLDATSYGRRHAAARPSNRLTYVEGQPFTVSFTNQGENDEFNIKVTLKIARRESGDRRSRSTRPCRRSPRARRRRSSCRSTASRRSDAAVNDRRSTVAKVPGEKTNDNNKSTLPDAVRRRASLSGVSEFSDAPGIVALAAAGAALIALIWLLVLSFRFRRLRSAQKVVLGEHGQADLVAHARRPAARVRGAARPRRGGRRRTSTQRMAAAEDRLDGAIAYRALVRYDAYGEMSGHQSTTIALLDADHNGVVLSSIAHRDTARLYCKQVHAGRGEHQLSPEEEEAVRLALAGGEVGSVILESS